MASIVHRSQATFKDDRFEPWLRRVKRPEVIRGKRLNLPGATDEGTTPLGYCTPGLGQGMEPVLEEQATIRRNLTLRRRGRSYRAIAAQLAKEGHGTKRGAHWLHSTVGNIVRSHERRKVFTES